MTNKLKDEFREAGFQVPRQNFILESRRFWQLIREGWRFVLDQDGVIVACLPPMLNERLAALQANNHTIQRPGRHKR